MGGLAKTPACKCTRDEQGNLIIPASYVENLERQIAANYGELTEKERDYDREEVLKNWPLIVQLGTQ